MALALLVRVGVGVAEEEAQPLAVAELERSDPVDFNREILPILRKNCIACHNKSKERGDLILETHETVLAGLEGEEPVIEPGKSAESILFRVSAHLEKPLMPPPDNKVGAKPLSPEELAILKLWIDQGAKPGEAGADSHAYPWHPLPAGKQPIYAVALSEDGQHAACARANQVFVHHLPTAGTSIRLSDPALVEKGIYDRPGVAHLDHVQSLAFHPRGRVLASGSYRTVKLWRRGADALGTTWSLPRSGEPEGSKEGGEATAAAVSLDGDWLAVGDRDGAVFVCKLGGPVRPVGSKHTGEVTAVEFTSDGAHVVSAGSDGSVRIVAVASGEGVGEILDTTAPVRSMALVDGGARVLTGGADGVIRLWKASYDKIEAVGQAESGEEEKNGKEEAEKADSPQRTPEVEFKGHEKAVTALAILPAAGEQFLSGGEDGSVRRWDRKAGKEIRRVDHGAAITAVAIRPDGQVLASAGVDKTVKLWKADDGKQLAAGKGDFRLERDLLKRTWDRKISENRLNAGKKAVENAENEVKKRQEAAKKASEALDAADKAVAEKKGAVEKATNDVKAAEKRVEEINVAAKQSTQAKSDAEKAKTGAEAAVKDAEEKATETRTAAAKFPENEFLKGAIEAAAKAIAARQADVAKAAEAIQLATAAIEKAQKEAKEAAATIDPKRKELDKIQKELKKTEEERNKKEPPAKLAAAALEDGRKGVEKSESDLEARTAAHGRCDSALEEAKTRLTDSERVVERLEFSKDNRQLCGVAADGAVLTWSASDGTPFDIRDGEGGGALAFVRRGETKFIAVGTDRVTIWDLSPTWTLERQLGDVDDPSVFVDRVTALAFSQDGELLVTGGGDPSRRGELKVWNVADGGLLLALPEAHSDSIFAVEFSADRRYVASCGADKFVKVFALADGKLVRAFEGHTNHVLGVSWRYDGEWLVSCGADNNVKVWDFERAEQRKNIGGFGKQVTSIRFIADTPNAIACSGDARVRLLQASDGKTLRDFGGPADYVYSVAATLEGRLIAAGGFDSVLRVWSQDGKALHTFEPPK